MKRILLCLMAFSAIISSCTRDHGDMYDPEFVREYYESQWKKQFGEIDPNQTWNVAQGVQANLSIKEDALADYTFNIYTSNPLYDKDAKLMAKTKVTTDADGYAETSINFDAPNGLKYFYVMRVNKNGRRAVKAIQAGNGVLNASFGDVELQGTRVMVEGDLESTKMTSPYSVEEVNNMIATGNQFSSYSGYINDIANGGVYVITGTEQSEGRFPIWCNNKTVLVIANGGVLNLNTSGSIGKMDIIVADGGTLNLISGNHTFNGATNDNPIGSSLIVMPGGLVEDKSSSETNNENDNNNNSTTTTLTHSYIKVQTQDKEKEEWDTQFFITWDSNKSLQPGQQWTFSAKIKAAQSSSTYTQTHTSPGNYISYFGVGPNDGVGLGDINFTTDWVTYTASGTVQGANQDGQNSQQGGYTIAFNLNKFAYANTYYFDDISFKLNGEEMIVNGDCSDSNVKTNFLTRTYGDSNLYPSEFETWTETITVENNNNNNNNNSGETFSLYPMNALIYNAGTMKNIDYMKLASSGTFYNAETGIYTGTDIYQGNDTDILTNWGKMEIARLGGNLQGTLNNGCLFRATERVEVLYLNQNANTALECCTIKTNFVTLRENSIIRANYYDIGYTPVLKYVGKSESSALITTDVLSSGNAQVSITGNFYMEADNCVGSLQDDWGYNTFINLLPYGLSPVGESDFAIFPAYKGDDLEKSDCTGHGNVPEDYVPPTPENGIVWIIACEDLGSIGDYDFNDIVFSVTYVAGNDTAVVQALAAGGTIPANVYVNNELIGEIHGLFGFDDTSKMINTLEEDLEDGSIFQGMVKKIIAPNFSISTADMGKIRIDIINGDGNVKTAIAPTQGGAPQMICVPAPWKWPVEYTSIGAAYPKFGLWGAGYNTGIDWYSTDIATGSVFNLE